MTDQSSPIPCTIQAPDSESAVEEIRRLQASPHTNFNVQIHAVLTADQISDAGRRGLAITRLASEASDQEMRLALDAMATILDRASTTGSHQPRDITLIPPQVKNELESITWQHFLKPGVRDDATILTAAPEFDAGLLINILQRHGIRVDDIFTPVSDTHRAT